MEYYSDRSQPEYYGYVITSVLVVLLFFRSFLVNHGTDYINEGVTKTYAAMYSSIYNRLLVLKESSKGTIGSGRIYNFFITDATFVADVLNMINNLWVAPFNLIVAMILLYMQVEWCAFLGVGMIVVMAFVQAMVMGKFIQNRFQNQAMTDIRTKLLQEFLEGIRVVKYYAWERFAHARIGEVRRKEIQVMSTALYLRILYEFLVLVLPIFTMVMVLSVYATAVGQLTVAKVFTVISLFKILQMPLWTFVTALICVLQVKASLQRVAKFFYLSCMGTQVNEIRLTA